MSRLTLSVLFVALLGLAHSGALASERLDPNNPPSGLFSDEWVEVHLMGGKVGYGHTTMTREGDRIRTSFMMFFRIERAGVKVEITQTESTLESLDGGPIEFESIMEMANQPTRMTGRIADGKVHIVTSQFGMERKHTLAFKPGALMLWGMYRETLLRGFEPGTEYTISAYIPSMRLDAPIPVSNRVGGIETYTHGGLKKSGRKVVTTIQAPQGNLETLSWVDADGSASKAMINMMGFQMEMYRVDQATAMADFVPPEFFLKTTIPSNRKIDGKSAQRIRYRISVPKDGKGMPDLPVTGMQSVVARGDDFVDLVIQRQDHKAIGATAKGHRAAGPGADYLLGNIVMNVDDPALIELARKAAGKSKAPIEVATKLREFVTQYITDKSLGIGFATASEVCRAREGDCSEHAVLLAALGRIRGIPSRVAVGLAYVSSFAGQKNIFGFHMWTQFWIGGEWVDFDAALRESECSPTRIAFSVSSFKDTGLTDVSFALMNVIGRIDVEVLTIDGK